jgi:hypothetical protein
LKLGLLTGIYAAFRPRFIELKSRVGYRRVTLSPTRDFSLQLAREVFEEDHVVLRLLRFRRLRRHQRGDAFAVRCRIKAWYRVSFLIL